MTISRSSASSEPRIEFSPLGIEILLEIFARNVAVETTLGNLELGCPEHGVENQLAKVGIAPVLVRMGAGEPEAAAAVGPLDTPGQHFVAALGFKDMGIGTSRRRRHTLPRLIVGLGGKNRRDPLQLRPESDIEIPLILDRKRLDAPGDRVLG